ncbi:MAG: hypothetical protein ACK2UK_06335 [Candidatus Promineifilaceae bacterium]
MNSNMSIPHPTPKTGLLLLGRDVPESMVASEKKGLRKPASQHQSGLVTGRTERAKSSARVPYFRARKQFRFIDCQKAPTLDKLVTDVYRLCSHYHESLLSFLFSVLDNAEVYCESLRVITGHVGTTGSKRMNFGLDFSRAREVKQLKGAVSRNSRTPIKTLQKNSGKNKSSKQSATRQHLRWAKCTEFTL